MNVDRWARSYSAVLLLLVLALPNSLAAQEPLPAGLDPALADRAPVVIDGSRLFFVSAVSPYKASERAARIRAAILEAARSDEITSQDITTQAMRDGVHIRAGETVLLTLLDSDVSDRGLSPSSVGELYRQRVVEAINSYRAEREPDRLVRATGFALAYLLALVVLMWLVRRVFRWLERWAERRLERDLRKLEAKSQKLLKASPRRLLSTGRVSLVIAGFIRATRSVILANLIYLTATRVLDLFPWTRSFASTLLRLFVSPLRELWYGLVRATPGLIFILVLFLVFKYLLSLMAKLFKSIEKQTIHLEGFDPDWAMPTYKIARTVLIALGIVIAFPYIPGSDSLAFKGLSVFVGVLLSIGSSSVIANTFAGLSMIYRRAFKVGDRVRIDEVEGHVRDIRLQTTQIVTPKNESVILPNSTIMNTNVTNYSQLARETGLIVHSTVGIGYDTSWQQVEAMLLEAAYRTEALLKEPPPFVLQKTLGDFAVDFEINAYSPTADGLPQIYSELHSHIRDVFNEYGVQIMSPAYVADPPDPKVVAPEDWYPAPAKAKRIEDLATDASDQPVDGEA
jgi:small-conductance mechanosensitive channel